jgi:hypothetical protein
MVFPRQFAPAVATVISLAFLLLDYRFHHSHPTVVFLYFWMAVYFLFVMGVTLCALFAFQIAIARWPSPSAGWSASGVIGSGSQASW